VSAGGDGFAVYKTVPSFDTHILFRDALAQNIQQTGHIIAQIQGRIKNVQSADPNEPVARAEFPDGAKASVAAAAESGIIVEKESGNFAPSDPATRFEAEAILSRTQSYIR